MAVARNSDTLPYPSQHSIACEMRSQRRARRKGCASDTQVCCQPSVCNREYMRDLSELGTRAHRRLCRGRCRLTAALTRDARRDLASTRLGLSRPRRSELAASRKPYLHNCTPPRYAHRQSVIHACCVLIAVILTTSCLEKSIGTHEVNREALIIHLI
ncbi:hypothetical protein OH76DRAFT_35000 [Lentinus brumalis]|uniref:Uncharacterized protein n=1 Tax=Lentinus brumalis TaxID=2498619 RepID=A0A371DXV8_9APHY|nr:hypothetical protein OH76DRAFT_35000 [Polyporus brumalis]